jgi:two-component system chemotaxis sensor kinase CheA
VDELHGENQTVIKPLGKLFENLNGIGGATVLGSGDVALILDVQGLIQHARKRVNPTLALTATV